jgi:hypothetical protein
MPSSAPLCVPVELRASGASAWRWFRLASAVSEDGLLFPRPLPDELDGAVAVTFVLPEDAAPIACGARVIEVATAEHADRRGVRFVALDPAARARIARYVEERSLA